MSGRFVRSPNWGDWEESSVSSSLAEVRGKSPLSLQGSVQETVLGESECRLGMEEICGIIPEFDPGNTRSLSAQQWIGLIESMKSIYQWTELRTLLYASLRLKGSSKYWYQAKQQQIQTWEDFKDELYSSFPCVSDESSIHLKLLQRKRQAHEPIENYFYEVVALARQAKLNDITTMNYIISGLNDKYLSNMLMGAKCKTTNELLRQIKSYESISRQESNRNLLSPLGKNKSREFKHNTSSQNKEGSTNSVRRCFQCGKEGHIKSQCRVLARRTEAEQGGLVFRGACYKCGKSGHRANSCQWIPQKRPGDITKDAFRKIQTITAGKNELYQNIDIDGKQIQAFIDLGSDCCTIRKIDCSGPFNSCSDILRGFAGGQCQAIGKIKKLLKVGDVQRFTELLIVDDNVQEIPVIIGQSFLNQPGVKVVKTWNKLKIEDEVTGLDHNNIVSSTPMNVATQMKITRQPILETDLTIGIKLSDEEKTTFLELINRYRDCFATKTSELGETSWATMSIKLKEEKIIRYHPYRVPYHQEEALREIIKELKENNIIEDSTSEYASPAILIRKKTGKYRMCIDYRRLNEITRREYFPTPNIEEELNQTAGGKIFMCLDLMCGYHQVPIEEGSKQYTAFVTPEGHYQFRKMPFGLTNAPACFMRLMDQVRKRVDTKKVRVYLDDIMIIGESTQDAMQIFENLLRVLREANLTLNVAKCVFFATTITFLGHEVGSGVVKPGKMKIKAIEEYVTPTTIKEIRQFLGLTGYFRKFIKNYAHKAAPLNQLLKKDTNFIWERKQEDAFKELKNDLLHEPVLAIYIPNAHHELHTDACSMGLAGILLQFQEEGPKQVVSYFSRTTTVPERKYASYELEALAVVESLSRFKYYLLGKRFTVVTDCNALKMTHAKKDLVPRIARWWLKIQEFDFELQFRAGKQMSHVDALSRATQVQEEETNGRGYEVMVVTTSEPDWIATLQLQDKTCREIYDALDDLESRHSQKKHFEKEYQIKGGRLFKKTSNGLKFVVPHGLRWRVIKGAHDDVGHTGVDRTIDEINKMYWFPKMSSIVKKYVNSCVECLYNQRHKDESRYQLNVPEIKPIPFHTVHIDHLGPYPRSSKGNTHLIGIVDAFKKFTVLKGVKNTRTLYVIRVLDELSQYFGTPERIITDRGSAFTSGIFQQFCTDHDITHIKTAVRTPRANGQVERYFRTVKTSISCMTKREDGRDWDVNIAGIQWGLNILRHKITGQSAFKLLLGYEPKSILQNKLSAVIHASSTDDEEDDIPLSELRELTADRVNTERIKLAEKFNKGKIPPTQYNKGDLILIKCQQPATGQPRKHLCRYRGPYIVDKVLEHDRYLLKDPPNLKVSNKTFESVYAADQMRPWCCLDDFEVGEIQTDDDEDEERQE